MSSPQASSDTRQALRQAAAAVARYLIAASAADPRGMRPLPSAFLPSCDMESLWAELEAAPWMRAKLVADGVLGCWGERLLSGWPVQQPAFPARLCSRHESSSAMCALMHTHRRIPAHPALPADHASVVCLFSGVVHATLQPLLCYAEAQRWLAANDPGGSDVHGTALAGFLQSLEVHVQRCCLSFKVLPFGSEAQLAYRCPLGGQDPAGLGRRRAGGPLLGPCAAPRNEVCRDLPVVAGS